MDLQLKGKVAIVGGGSTGLGRACAEVLAEEGANVAICSRTKGDLEKTAAEIRSATGSDVLAFPGDLDKSDTIKDLVTATVSHFGRLDILVNNSGSPPISFAYSATDEMLEAAVQRSLFYFARMSREAIPHFKAGGGGRIINILASTIYQPLLKMALSGMTRIGVTALAKSLADEVGKHGILVNNVCPGSILTKRMLLNITARAEEMGITLEEALAKRAAEIPVGRLGESRDVAYTVAFLASGKSGYITGSTIRVDGGVVRSLL